MVYELLGTGKENARSAKHLASVLKCDIRTISSLVESERRSGKPICATCNSKAAGYYIPTTKADMLDYCDSLHRRAGEIYRTRAACLDTAEGLPD